MSETPRDLRKKLSRSNASLNSVKDKYREKQYEQKKLNNCLSAMRANRDKWRLHSKENEILIKNLRQELHTTTQELDALKTQITTVQPLDPKKNRQN